MGIINLVLHSNLLMYYTSPSNESKNILSGDIMDFTQQNGRQMPPATQTTVPGTGSHNQRKKPPKLGWLKLSSVVLLFTATILVVALLIFVATDKPKNQEKYVNTKQMQAIFLNNGQVYFGHITTLNNKYLKVVDIYYLRQTEAPQPNTSNANAGSNNFSLVKLGCEIHGPDDSMIVNADQITFWENLKNDGQVAKAVESFKQQNPNGQQCSEPTSNSNTTTPTTTPTPTPTTNKKP